MRIDNKWKREEIEMWLDSTASDWSPRNDAGNWLEYSVETFSDRDFEDEASILERELGVSISMDWDYEETGWIRTYFGNVIFYLD